MNQDKNELTQEEIQKRAAFELEQLRNEKTRCAVQALVYLDKITHEASQLKAMTDNVDFKPENLREDHLGWIKQYTQHYNEWIVKKELISKTIDNLEFVFKIVKVEN
jgi:hypothetical protein